MFYCHECICFLLIFAIIFHVIFGDTNSSSEENVIYLSEGEIKRHEKDPSKKLIIFCHHEIEYSFNRIWSSCHFNIINAPKELQIISGSDCKQLIQKYSSLWVSLNPCSDTFISVPCFSHHCVGVETKDSIEMQFLTLSLCHSLLHIHLQIDSFVVL